MLNERTSTEQGPLVSMIAILRRRSSGGATRGDGRVGGGWFAVGNGRFVSQRNKNGRKGTPRGQLTKGRIRAVSDGEERGREGRRGRGRGRGGRRWRERKERSDSREGEGTEGVASSVDNARRRDGGCCCWTGTQK
jgi:hypothetical protein